MEKKMCEVCFGAREIETLNSVMEPTGRRIPCPECCKDFYKDNRGYEDIEEARDSFDLDLHELKLKSNE